jgi:hypothetical protein
MVSKRFVDEDRPLDRGRKRGDILCCSLAGEDFTCCNRVTYCRRGSDDRFEIRQHTLLTAHGKRGGNSLLSAALSSE